MDTRRLKDDLQSLVGEARARKGLPALGAAKPLPAATGTAQPKLGSGSSTLGIASPLTEPDATTRTYHADTLVTSTDGIFTFVLRRLHKLDAVDAKGHAVQFVYDDPAT